MFSWSDLILRKSTCKKQNGGHFKFLASSGGCYRQISGNLFLVILIFVEEERTYEYWYTIRILALFRFCVSDLHGAFFPLHGSYLLTINGESVKYCKRDTFLYFR